MEQQSDTTVFKTSSGTKIILDDSDSQLRKCFESLFGSVTTGAAVIANTVQQKAKKQQNVCTRSNGEPRSVMHTTAENGGVLCIQQCDVAKRVYTSGGEKA